MNSLADSASSFPSSAEDILIKQLLLTHDPDGRWLDSDQLISAVENVMSFSSSPDVKLHTDGIEWKDEDEIEIFGSEETLGHTLWQISSQVFFGKGNQHPRTMAMFDSVRSYSWDAKVVLVLAAFATSYGQFRLVKQLHRQNSWASSIAMLRQFPLEMITFGPRFKALDLLFKTMVDVTKLMIKFEGLPFRHVKLDFEPIGTTKDCIYVAAYWVVRSSLSCFSMVSDLKAMKPPEKVYSNSSTVAAWEMLSLESRLSKICSRLSETVDTCHRLIEAKMHRKLSTLFWEDHSDNQEVLQILLALKDNFPLKEPSTKSKLGVSELKDKVVILVISKPQLLPLDDLLLLVHQTYGHTRHNDFKGRYCIIWVPITESDKWSDAEEERFNMLSNSLPWYSVRRPWRIHSAAMNYMRLAWQSRADPAMVVLDSKGTMTNLNALDMVSIWGSGAFPFSAMREQELLAEQKHLTIQFLVDEIDPLLTKWVEEGRNICIYGSESLDWIQELNAKAREISRSGIQLEMVYAGASNLSENVRNISDIINETMHRTILSFTKLRFFWLRIESMRSSKLQQGGRLRHDHVLQDVSALLHPGVNGGWAVIGRGFAEEVVRVEGRKAFDLLSKVDEWGENVVNLGLVGALRAFLAPPIHVLHSPEPCNHSVMIPYGKGPLTRSMRCKKCSRLMKPYIVYE